MTALALVLLALLLLGAAAPLLARRAGGEAALQAACGAAAGVLASLGAGALALGVAAPPLALPLASPWGPLRLALDGLSAWFLLPLGLCAAAAALAGPRAVPGPVPPRRLAAPPLLLAGLGLAVLAADGFGLLLGFGLVAVVAAGLAAREAGPAASRRAVRGLLLASGGGALCLAAAFGLAAAGGSGESAPDFAALRAHPPEGWRAAAFHLLALAGIAWLAGLLPGRRPPPLAAAATAAGGAGPAAALLLGALPVLAPYAAARLLLDLGGPAQPPWWGVPPLLAGAALACAGAARAATAERDADSVVAALAVGQSGLALAALGLAAGFRAADLGPLAALAAGAGLLQALHQAAAVTLLMLVAEGVRRGAGSRRLDRLGGLVRTMPWTAGGALLAAASLAALPPLSGFAAHWLLLQGLFAAWRVGDAGFQFAALGAALLAALAAALAAAALVRFYGLAFLGPPRTPRAAGAAETLPRTRIAALALPAGFCVLVGLVPGALLAFADPALQRLAGASVAPRAGLLGIAAPGVDAPEAVARLVPPAVALLLALVALALALALRRWATPGLAEAPAWTGGAMAPPPHLPFGDPAIQPSAAGMAQPLRRAALGLQGCAAARPLRRAPDDPRPAVPQAAAASWVRPLRWARRALRAANGLAMPGRLRVETRRLPVRRVVGRLFAILLGLLAALLALAATG
nr:proton-conducting transporter membrane subunit [Caldovatus aquaticus]